MHRALVRLHRWRAPRRHAEPTSNRRAARPIVARALQMTQLISLTVVGLACAARMPNTRLILSESPTPKKRTRRDVLLTYIKL